MRPRSVLPAAALLALFTSATWGCTFLIAFDEVPLPEDGGVEAQADAPRTPVLDADARAHEDAGDAAEDATDLDALTACEGMASGLYCGNNQIKDYPGSKDDLVLCDGGKVWEVTHCDGGSGCIRMPNPQPDQCDECWRKADGFFCGRDMPGWTERNAKVRVQCMAGGQVGILVCATNCISDGTKSRCQ
jgi:hypothetical protein